MSRKPSERRHSKDVDNELNLAPIMSILVILIPMLIFAFQFYEITVQTVDAPKLGTGKAKASETNEDPPLNLTVLIGKDGFTVKQQADTELGEEPPVLKKKTFTICKAKTPQGDAGWQPCPPVSNDDFHVRTVSEYDFPGLYSMISAKKQKYPTENTINIGGDFKVPWHVVARTIDAVRIKLSKKGLGESAWADSFSQLDEYRKAPPFVVKTTNSETGKEESKQQPLFPKVTFVVAE
jgi:biopolymer transport protein ExbD